MELKLPEIQVQRNAGGLLIVPYGIETSSILYSQNPNFLLIVPYGIETGI